MLAGQTESSNIRCVADKPLRQMFRDRLFQELVSELFGGLTELGQDTETGSVRQHSLERLQQWHEATNLRGSENEAEAAVGGSVRY